MPGTSRSQDRARKAAAARQQQQRAERRRRVLLAGGSVVAVLAVIAALVVVGLTRSSPPATPAARQPAPAAAVTDVTTVPAARLSAVAAGGTSPSLFALDGKVLQQSGKPRVLYVGAEYCPFCAAERWAVVVALSRFGTWSGLGQTASATDDVYPGTATFSFAGASFTSRYLSFEGVETATNVRAGTGYAPLQKLTADQQRIVQTYDAPPYVPAQSAGSIPFLDIAGLYGASGSGFSPAVLTGKSVSQIAAEVHAGTSPAARAVLGTANRITAALCAATHDQPAAVCRTAPVPALAAQLPHVP